MSCKDFKTVDATKIPIGKLISIISKGQKIFINRKLNEFGINSTQLYLLFELDHHNEMNQDKIASRCNINKGAAARSIKKLEDMELVIREIDSDNRRQNKVYLTPKGKEVWTKSTIVLNKWEDEIFDDELISKEEFQLILKQIAINIMEINEREAKDDKKEE